MISVSAATASSPAASTWRNCQEFWSLSYLLQASAQTYATGRLESQLAPQTPLCCNLFQQIAIAVNCGSGKSLRFSRWQMKPHSNRLRFMRIALPFETRGKPKLSAVCAVRPAVVQIHPSGTATPCFYKQALPLCSLRVVRRCSVSGSAWAIARSAFEGLPPVPPKKGPDFDRLQRVFNLIEGVQSH